MNLLRFDVYRRARRKYGRRRFQAFTIAAGKSGTHSIANMFNRYYRSAHEPAAAEMIDVLSDKLAGKNSAKEVSQFLKQRDERLQLEMDSSGLNSIAASELVQLFPDARFIITMRDCFSWANSWFNQMLNNPSPSPHWQKWRVTLHGSLESCTYTQAEEALKETGTWALERVFKGWSTMYSSGLDAAPADRTLFIHTHRLGSDIGRLATFLEVPEWTIDSRRSHTYKAPKDRRLLHQLDPNYVNELANDICGDVMKEFYPRLPCKLGTDYKV